MTITNTYNLYNMKRQLIFLLFLFACATSHAQVAYEYDAAGNRIQRYPVHSNAFPSNGEAVNAEVIQIYVSPNPTSGPFTLTITGTEQTGTFPIIITDAYGTPIVNTTGTALTTQMDISSLHNGYYLVYITLNGKQYCKKIVKT